MVAGDLADLVGFVIFLVNFGGGNPICLYDGRWSFMERDMLGLVLGLDLIQPA